mgnify:FL=1
MSSEPNDITVKNEQNENNQDKKIISSNVIDFTNLEESDNKKLNEEDNIPLNIKSINNNNNFNNFDISTFKKEEWNKPIKIYNKEEIINKMNIIFKNYATYSSKKNIYLISIENIIKILREIKILPELIKLYQIDIIIKKICPKIKNIVLDDFVNIFIKIAQKIFPKEFRTNKDLLLNHFFHNIFTFYNSILNEELAPLNEILKYSYSSILSLMNIAPDDSQILVLNSLLYTLNEIYEKYFVNNKSSKNIDNNPNLSNLFYFCKDFEVFPFIFNETQIITYYNTVLEKKELFKLIDDSKEKKNTFTFNNFILLFIHLAEYNYAKVYQNFTEEVKQETQLSKLIMLLTKLECSKGMRNIIMNSLPNLSLMPNKELLLKYNFIFKKESETLDNLLNNNLAIEDNYINNGGENDLKENLIEEKI